MAVSFTPAAADHAARFLAKLGKWIGFRHACGCGERVNV